MTDTVFVAREEELTSLSQRLDLALAGKGQVVFISGEAGSGKTALLNEFSHRAMQKHPDLIFAMSSCNAQTGAGEAYQPFREILGLLSGNMEATLAAGAIAPEAKSRIRTMLVRSGLVMLDIAPSLIKLVPVAGPIIGPVSSALLKQAKLDKRLEESIETKSELEELTEQPISQEQMFEQCYKFLNTIAEFQPLAIAIDDLQWADTSSLNLLFYLARRMTDSRVLILGGFRPDEIAAGRAGARHPTEQIYTEIKRLHGDITIELTRPSGQEALNFVNAFLDSEPNDLSPAFRTALAHHTGGHPLFVVELLRDFQDHGTLIKDDTGHWIEGPGLNWRDTPARIDGVIRTRVDRLTESDRQILSTASVEGDHFIAEVISALQRIPERELVQRLGSELSRRHQLVEAEGIERLGQQRISSYRFRHQLIQQFLYDQLDEVERAYLHEDTGNTLELLYAGFLEEIAVELSWHYAEAGVDSKAATYAALAGKMAASCYANDEAIKHFTQALQYTADGKLTARLELLLDRERVYGWKGQREAQKADLDQLAALAASLNDPLIWSQVELRLANYLRLTGQYDVALDTVQRALKLAEQASDPLQEAHCYALWGRLLLHTSRERDAREWLELAEEMAEQAGDDRLQALCLYDLGHTYFGMGRTAEATEHYQQALTLFTRLFDRKGETNCLLMLGAVNRQEGNHDDALRRYEEALNACRTLGWRHGESFVLSNLGNTYLILGDFEQADESHHAALAIGRDVADRQGEALNLDTLGLVAHFQNDPAQAQALYEESLAIQRSLGYLRGQAYTLTHMALLAEEGGDLDAAAAAQEAALAIRGGEADKSGASIDNLAGLARVAQGRGDLTEALRLAGLVEAMLADAGVAGVEFPALAYLTLYQVFSAAGQNNTDAATRATATLQQGQSLVRAQAGKLDDPVMRQRYLDHGPYNRQLLSA